MDKVERYRRGSSISTMEKGTWGTYHLIEYSCGIRNPIINPRSKKINYIGLLPVHKWQIQIFSIHNHYTLIVKGISSSTVQHCK